ncbi:hypothetical protein JG688_00017857 [Phytophthora aleatoria]|uniref:Uncharacterized protein n=1 Tax=Phytophthora aleatoria TaxID=2496075 RepID=A0A8J5I2Q1_9STRA|nr:hypothetical protein JG688_00017857 [Phytophthora aleatoria]
MCLSPVRIKLKIAQITVWDAEPTGSVGSQNMKFRPGAVYLFHCVEYARLFDDIARGTVVYDSNDADKIREASPPVVKRTIQYI